MADKHDKRQRLGATLDHLKAKWGSDILRPSVSGNGQATVAALPTGFAALDRALGIGGAPCGHLTFLQGIPTSGAGTLALKIAASATAAGQPVAYLDLAGTFDPDYAARCGLNLEQTVVIRPVSLAGALDSLSVLFNAVGAAILDPASPPDAAPARDVLRRLTAQLRTSTCALVVLGRGGLEPFAGQAALCLDIRRERWLLRRRDVRGYRARVHIRRNRFAPPGQTVRLLIGFSGAVRGDGL